MIGTDRGRLRRYAVLGRVSSSTSLSIIATVGGLLVGLAGVASTFITSQRQHAITLQVAREQAERQSILAHTERQHRHLEAAYGSLVSWLANCEETAQTLNHELWRSHDPDSDSESVRNADGTFGRPAKVYEHSHLWSRSVWDAVRAFTDAARQMWDRCHQLHVVKQKAIGNKLGGLEIEGLKLESDVFGPLYDAIDRVRSAVRAELIAPHPSTDFDLNE